MKIIHVSLSNNSVTVKVIQSCPTVCNPMEYTVLGILQARILEWVPFSRRRSLLQETFPSPGDLPNPGIEPRSPKLQADSLPAELPGNPHSVIIFTQYCDNVNERCS